MRILQVEDDPITAKTVEKMLAAQGHQCETTPSGEDAVTRASSTAFDLILLDIMLPDIDGYEVIRRLSQSGITTPVVIQTGLVSRENFAKGPSLGSEYYVLKPFSKDELGACIDAAVGDSDGAPVKAPEAGHSDRQEKSGDTGAGRRRHPRIRTLKSAQIIFNNQTCVADCLVINTSESGAALQLNDFFEYPALFLLKIHCGPTYRCEVCWQRGTKMGVRFLES